MVSWHQLLLFGKELSTITLFLLTMIPDLPAIRQTMQELHDSGINRSYEWRVDQLERMRQLVLHNRPAITQALYNDLGKSYTEAVGAEITLLLGEIDHSLTHLKQWIQPQHVGSPAATIPAWTTVTPCPKVGPACLILGPSNYPFSLSLQPAVGALAAGNPVIIKPSELCTATAELLQQLCDQYFDPSAVKLIQGGIPETQQLLQEPWGLIFFTGSEKVGKIVATAAAQTLTPTILELGGKCPAYVDCYHPPLQQMADRIVWAKFFNTGQTCAAIDTLVVHQDVVDTLVPALLTSLEQQYPGPRQKSELGRIVTKPHAQRLYDWIAEVEQNPECQILCGGTGECCVDERYIAPTLLLNPPADCQLAQEEIFGPILPIVTVSSEEDAITYIRQLYGTPLCLYLFTQRTNVFDRIRLECRAGGVMRNDALIFLASQEAPFGGLGTSGYGSYHGKYSFEAFSHYQTCMTRATGPGLDFGNLRCHPFGDDMPHQRIDTTKPILPHPRSFKSRILDHIFQILPDIPVLHTRRVVFTCLVLLLTHWCLPREAAAGWLAHRLEWMAATLRGSCIAR
jgi:acyl-CoA reductase-like NAD-dependent aldehyde dehydrogenase